jgi:hypothetical protein
MKKLLLCLVISLAACGGDSEKLPQCDVRAEGSHGLKCTVGADTECRSQVGDYNCACLCDGYWECDEVKLTCDSGVDSDLGPQRD